MAGSVKNAYEDHEFYESLNYKNFGNPLNMP